MSERNAKIFRMPRDLSADAYAFQVDLRGLVDLLSQHLYSSPRIYVRELLQNAVDATTARRLLEPSVAATVRIVIHDGGLSITDSGVGLT
jgi:molecular chaperone HtpG